MTKFSGPAMTRRQMLKGVGAAMAGVTAVAATPMTSNGRPWTEIVLPIGSVFGKNSSLRSFPMKATSIRLRFSASEKNRPLAMSIAEFAAESAGPRPGPNASATMARIKAQARELFEPTDASLSDQLVDTLDRMHRVLARPSNGNARASKPSGLGRIASWFK